MKESIKACSLSFNFGIREITNEKIISFCKTNRLTEALTFASVLSWKDQNKLLSFGRLTFLHTFLQFWGAVKTIFMVIFQSAV